MKKTIEIPSFPKYIETMAANDDDIMPVNTRRSKILVHT